MARPRIREVALALVFMMSLALASASPLWATHRGDDNDNPSDSNVIYGMTFNDMQRMTARLPSLLPTARLKNESAMHHVHVRGVIKWASSLPITQFTMEAGNVNFRPGWHPKPYATGAEDLSMFQLGMLVGYTHFAMVNANIPEMKDFATTMLGEFDTITANTMLSDMNAGVKSLEQEVADPSYNGGPTKTLDHFDQFSMQLCQRIKDMYWIDGFWYYAAGIDLSGLTCVPQTDSFNAPYFRNYLEMLYNHEPTTGVPQLARHHMNQILRGHFYLLNLWGNQMDHAQGAEQAIIAAGPGQVWIRK